MYLPQFHFFQSTHVCNYTYPSDEIFRDFSTKKGKPSFGRFAALEIYTDIFRKLVGDDEEKKELSNHAIEAIERIRWLVTGMLQIAKLESGAYQMEKKNCR